jgi:hypothetical protein
MQHSHAFHAVFALHKIVCLAYIHFQQSDGIAGAQIFDPHTPPPSAGSIDRRHSSSQSLVCKNDAHRTSSPGGRYFFAQFAAHPHRLARARGMCLFPERRLPMCKRSKNDQLTKR